MLSVYYYDEEECATFSIIKYAIKTNNILIKICYLSYCSYDEEYAM